MKTIATFLMSTALLFGSVLYLSSNTAVFAKEKAKKVVASKVMVTKNIPVTDFQKLNVSGCADVTFVQEAGAPHVEVFTSDNIVDLLDIYVRRGTLYVGFKSNVSVSVKKLEVRVTAETLTDVSLSGSGDVKMGKVSSENTEIGIVGSGDVSLKGTTCEAVYSVSGSGDINAKNYKAHNVSARIIGSGDITCYAEEHLEARVSGSGEIGYKGFPTLDASKKGVKRL